MLFALIDFSPEQRQEIQHLYEIVRLRKGACVGWEQLRIMELYRTYGFEIMRSCLSHCMDMEWYRPTLWTIAARLFQKFGVERTIWAIERVAGRNNYSIDTAEGILKKEIDAYRKSDAAKGAQKPAGGRYAPERSYPPPSHIYTQGEAARWLVEQGKPQAEVFQYFDRAGEFYMLKLEYRMPIQEPKPAPPDYYKAIDDLAKKMKVPNLPSDEKQ